MIARSLCIAGLAVLLLGCNESETASVPSPVTLTAEAAGHYCQMTVLNHPGPKAQVHLAGVSHPLFFSQVRDALAFRRMPEQAAPVVVIYVNDMDAAQSWDRPGIDNWIVADKAFYVIDSRKRGGMGAPELVPFRSEDGARDFAMRHGGKVIGFSDITDTMVLAPVEIELPEPVKPVARDGHGNNAERDG